MNSSFYVPRNGSVSIATCYGLDSSGIEFRWGRDFPHQSRRPLDPTQPPIQWISGLFSRGKAGGPWRWPPIHIINYWLLRQ